MESWPPGSEALLEKKEELLREVCRLFESALVAAKEGDLEGAALPGKSTERILPRLLEIDGRLPRGRSTAEIDTLLERALGLHASLLAALEERKGELAEKLRSARSFRRMLKGYRRHLVSTGRRLDVDS